MKMLKFTYLAVFSYKATLQLMQGLYKSCVLLLLLLCHICKNNIDSFLHFKSTQLHLFRFWGVVFLIFAVYRSIHTRIPYAVIYFIYGGKTERQR